VIWDGGWNGAGMGRFGRSCEDERVENRVLEAFKNFIFEEGTQ